MKAVILLALTSLAMAAAPLAALASSGDLEVPVNATTISVVSTVNASISLTSTANITLATNVTLLNATASASWNAALPSNSSATNATVIAFSLGNFSISEYATAIAELVFSAAEALENVTLLQQQSDSETTATSEFDFSNFTTDELVELLDLSSIASLELGLSDLVDEIANVTVQSQSRNASAQFENETITFASAVNTNSNASASVSVTAETNVTLNANSADNSDTTTLLSVQNTSIALQAVQVAEVNASTASSSTSDAESLQVQENQASIEVEALEQSVAQVLSHSLEAAVTRTFTVIEEAAHAASQPTKASPALSASTGSVIPASETFTATASAPDSMSTATASTGSEWIPTVAAVGAVAVVLVAALFGYQRRSQSGYNVLSPGSAALATLTPPRALNV